MRIFDLLKLAAKTLKGRWAVLPVAGITIGMFCLCFGGAVLNKVQQDKSVPCELNVSSGAARISDNNIVEILKIPDVSAATPLLTVPATVKTGEYSAELTLIGIVPGYLNNEFKAGGSFPNNSVMPYIILNNAACKKFSNGNKDILSESVNEKPDINWLNAEITVTLGENKKPVVSKVCGILSGEEEGQQPLAYISISCAKDLLQRENRNADYTGAYIRIKNIGYSENVTKEIETLGLTVSNPGEEQQKEWDLEMKETAYLIVTGTFSLLCAAALIASWRKIFRLENKEGLQMFRWSGMTERTIGRIVILQALILTLVGIFLGIIISLSLPSFLQSSPGELSVFMLSIPFAVFAVSVIITVCICMLPFMYSNKKSLK